MQLLNILYLKDFLADIIILQLMLDYCAYPIHGIT